MVRVTRQDKENVLKKLYSGEINAACLSTTSLVDDIILSMKKHGLIDYMTKAFPDRRADNSAVPLNMVLALSIAAKMRVHTSLTDIPTALTDHRTLGELGYSMIDTDGNLGQALMTEGTIRNLVGKYKPEELIQFYNKYVQECVFPKQNIETNVHILDCTKLRVNPNNEHYEKAGIVSDDEGFSRGYKLASLRGIVKDSGIIEHIDFGPINAHDYNLSKDMLLTTPVLKYGDILINDRGFLSREMINRLKTERGVDTYVPLRKNMEAYNIAVNVAKENDEWQQHPSRPLQKIAFVNHLENYWRSDNEENDVPINACVVTGNSEDDYCAVFVTTDTTKSAAEIIKTYELRPEIEEDYRQLKDFWKLEDFKSTKLSVITYHIGCTLVGYLFYQLYTMLPEGEKYAGRSLPVLLKGYQTKAQNFLVVYAGNAFGVFTLVDFMRIYSACDDRVKSIIDYALEKT